MASKVQSLVHDPDHYVKAYHCFTKVFGNFDVFANFAARVLGEKIVPDFSVTLGEKEELRVLAIGSGPGEIDVKLLSKLLQRFPLINNRVVEPAEGHVAKFKALVQSMAHELHGVNFDWRQQTMEQYKKGGDSTTKFHFVHAVHSLYYVEDLDRSLMYLYDLLEPGGALFVAMISKKSQMGRFEAGLSPDVQDDIYKSRTAADVQDSLDKQGIPHAVYHLPMLLNVTKCFDPSSEEGSLVLDVITQLVKVRETASAEFLEELMQLLTDCTEKRGNEFFMSDDSDVIVVSKPTD